MSSNFSLYRDAILDDGCFVLRQVVTILYQGGNLRPDIYFKENEQQQKYNRIFPKDQRHIIESSGDQYNYDIVKGAEKFDVSILSYLVAHTCGLPSSDTLVKKVSKVRSLRNNVSHPQGEVSLTKSELCEKLEQLLEWYITILERIEFHTNRHLISEKTQTRRRIQIKRSRAQDSPSTSMDTMTNLFVSNIAKEFYTPTPSWTVHSSRSDFDDNPYSRSSYGYSAPPSRSSTSTTRSDSGIPTWGKVALGVTAGIAALGVVGAVADAFTKDEEQSKQKKRGQKDEECAVM